MITTSPVEFLAEFGQCTPDPLRAAVPSAVFMIEPVDFHVSPATAGDNQYMDLNADVDAERALEQHNSLAKYIEGLGLEVKVFPGEALQPDGVFLNNAFATVPGRLIVGRMATAERQRETARNDVRDYFCKDRAFQLIDLSGEDLVAELTGVMILDRSRAIGYCGMTERVDAKGCATMHAAFGNRLTLSFDLNPSEYHTNVVLSVLAGRACVLVPEAFADPEIPAAISQVYPGRTLVLNQQEKQAFSGNCIALTERDFLISRTGLDGLSLPNRHKLADWGFSLHPLELDELEKAGGSLRCLIAELF